MIIRTIIVDDEPLARERIVTMLRNENGIEVVAECGNGADAVSAIRKQKPDLLFLDIQMPGMDGFEVLRQLGKEVPVVIFVTAYDQHALKAFEVHALDYLLKPFKQSRFQAALKRARDRLKTPAGTQIPSELLELLEQLRQPRKEFLARIPVKTGQRTTFIKTAQIDYAESAGNYVVLHVGKENHVVRETMTALEEKLDPKKFVRINRSTVVNVEQIKEVQPLFKGDHVVLLHNGKQLSLTRGVRELEELLRFS